MDKNHRILKYFDKVTHHITSNQL